MRECHSIVCACLEFAHAFCVCLIAAKGTPFPTGVGAFRGCLRFLDATIDGVKASALFMLACTNPLAVNQAMDKCEAYDVLESPVRSSLRCVMLANSLTHLFAR